MKPPTIPMRFQTSHRHYHHQRSRAGAWDNWVGSSEGKSKSLFFKMFLILAGIAMLAGALLVLR